MSVLKRTITEPAVVALGANQGDRRGTLLAAVRELGETDGVELVAMMAAGVALVASAPLSYTNSADFSRYLPAGTRVRDVALWTTLGLVIPGILATFVGSLAASAVDMTAPEAGLEKLLPAWFAPIFLISVIVGTIANNAMTAYSSGLALQAVGVKLPRSRTVLLDGTVGVAMTLFALLVWNFLDSVSSALQLGVTILAPIMGVYLADMLWRRNRYDGPALADDSRASRFWFTGGFHLAGVAAVLVGIDRAGLVVNPEPVHQCCAGGVEPHDIDRRALAPQAQHHLVERADGGDVPEVGAAHVDAHAFDGFLEVETRDEGL